MNVEWLYRIFVPRTLFFRISNISWLLLIIVAAGQYFVMTFYWRQAVDTVLQRLNFGLAEVLAIELLEQIEGRPLNNESVDRELVRLENLNPGVDIFILDRDGRIEWPTSMAFYNARFQGFAVPRHVLDAFYASGELASLPVYGPSPLFYNQAIFSAADFRLEGEQKTLYVSIFGRRFQVLIDAIEAVYFSFGGAIALAVLGICTVCMGFVAFFLVTRPFRRTVAAVHSFALGNLDARVPVRGTDELARLGTEINAMAQTAVDSLEQVRQLDAARRRMVAMISHDLGAPLRSTQGELERARMSLEDDQHQQLEESLSAANKSINRLISHVEELFELSKLETSELQPQFEHFSLLDVVTEEVVPQFAVFAREAEVSVEVEYQESASFLVYADLAMIERVLSNLLQNAIRYNRRGGKVSISLKTLGHSVEVAVADTGRGIAAEELEHIFEPFAQSASAHAAPGSSGLGLAIVKQILNIHNQRIHVESEPGKGSTFRFSLPTDVNVTG